MTDHLSVEYAHTEAGIVAHQSKYVSKLLTSYSYHNVYNERIKTPAVAYRQGYTFQTGVEKLSEVSMQEAVGKLLWLMRCTRPSQWQSRNWGDTFT